MLCWPLVRAVRREAVPNDVLGLGYQMEDGPVGSFVR
jgi:hypothetical protein